MSSVTTDLTQRVSFKKASKSVLALHYLLQLLLFSCAGRAKHVLDDSHKFLTRPDIEAPRWNITVYEPELVSPGFWFVDSYDFLDQSTRTGGYWTAPHIFDQQGELIWSGAYLSEQYDTFDFRVSNVLGEDMLTFLYPRNRTAIILDKHFNIRKIFQVSSPKTELDNMHDLHFVDNGQRVLYFYDETKNLSASRSEAMGFTRWNCAVRENGFRERDLTNDWEVTFDWSSSDHVAMNESSFMDRFVEQRCTMFPQGWDFIHTNSLDRFPDDGSYLMSARHTDTIYKIAPNGSITWRLGGIASDFQSDFKFAKQHHARILEHNSTHTIMSFLDNADSEAHRKPASPYSRGLIVALRTDVHPMVATMLSEYPHPNGRGTYLLGRGSVQVLPDKNVFSCWVHGCQHTEHTPDGKLIMEAHVKQQWLKSYRSYKFPFIGLPAQPPDVHATTRGRSAGDVTTLAYVSWNGATEVAMWNLYKTDEDGNYGTKMPTASLKRSGFETAFEIGGYVSYIVLEALDKQGKTLGSSRVFKTIVKEPLSDDVLAQETMWLQDFAKVGQRKSNSKTTILVTCIVCGTIVPALAAWIIWLWRKGTFSRARNEATYELVPNENVDSLATENEDEEVQRKSTYS